MKPALVVATLAVACSPMRDGHVLGARARRPDSHRRQVLLKRHHRRPGRHGFQAGHKAAHIDEAIATIRAAAAASPGDASFHYDLAILHEIKGDWAAALTEIRECRRLRPRDSMYGDEETFIARHAPAP